MASLHRRVNWAQGDYLESYFIKPGSKLWVPDDRE